MCSVRDVHVLQFAYCAGAADPHATSDWSICQPIADKNHARHAYQRETLSSKFHVVCSCTMLVFILRCGMWPCLPSLRFRESAKCVALECVCRIPRIKLLLLTVLMIMHIYSMSKILTSASANEIADGLGSTCMLN